MADNANCSDVMKIPACQVYQYLIKKRDDGEVKAVLTLFKNIYSTFCLDTKDLEPLSFTEYFDEEILWTDSYSEIAEAIGRSYIDITNMKIEYFNCFQIPYGNIEDEEKTYGTIHDLCGELFSHGDNTLFSITPTFYFK